MEAFFVHLRLYVYILSVVCVFLCLCACFVERCKQAVGGGLQAQYSSRESGVEALVAAPQVVRRHTLNRKRLVFDAQYAASLFATLF